MATLMLAAGSASDFTMAPRDIGGMLFMGTLILVLWLLYRKVPGLTPGEDEKKPPEDKKPS